MRMLQFNLLKGKTKKINLKYVYLETLMAKKVKPYNTGCPPPSILLSVYVIYFSF